MAGGDAYLRVRAEGYVRPAMCGRFFLSTSNAELARHFGLAAEPTLAPRFNIAPSQPVPVVRQRSSGERVVELRTWGFLPRFASDPRNGERPINARAEGIATRPLFREAFAHRRGLVPASGFYEWQHRGRSARPFAVRVQAGRLFAMAALFDRFEGAEGAHDSCAIVTTAANARVAAIHDRMPAILAPENYARWLDPASDPARLLALLQPCPDAWIDLHPVDRRVNDVRCDDAELAEPERDLFTLSGGGPT